MSSCYVTLSVSTVGSFVLLLPDSAAARYSQFLIIANGWTIETKDFCQNQNGRYVFLAVLIG